MLHTMPDLKWTVRVHHWTWVYAFSRIGTVSWRDPFNGMSGTGNWRIEKNKLITRWLNSKTWEEWELPLYPNDATGQCHMKEGTYDLQAVALNYYLEAGDVVTVAGKQYVIYADEVRAGGTYAWLCRNPGNIRAGEKYGAYKGKALATKHGNYAIFPDEATGLQAVVSVLREYGRVTINQAMNKYAPKGDGRNDPDLYARILAGRLGVKDSTYLNTLSDAQMATLAEQITKVEGSNRGEVFTRDDARLPTEVRQRLARRLYPPTEEELRNSSLAQAWW